MLTNPRLRLLRFKRISPTRYVITVQNDGQRQVAIFGAMLDPNAVPPTMGSTPDRPTVSKSLKIETIDIPFDDSSVISVALPVPAVVDAGDIVSINVTLSDQFTEGDILIDQSTDQPLYAGRFEVRPLRNSRRPSYDPSVDDLFGAPSPPAPANGFRP